MTDTAEIGMNLAAVSFYGSEHPFIDRLKNSSGWAAWGSSAPVQLDRNGYPLATPAGASEFVTAVGLDPLSAGTSSTYVVTYTGTATFNLYNATVLSRQPGRVVFQYNVPNTSGVAIYVSGLDANSPLGDMHVVRSDQESLLAAGEIFNPEFTSKISAFDTLRYMDWMNTNATGVASWSDRTQLSYATWQGYGDNNVPIEVMVALANKTRTNMWLNVPTKADDDYVRQMMTYVRDHLDPTLSVSLEYSNEVWNWGFGQHSYALQQGSSLWDKDVDGDGVIDQNNPAEHAMTNGSIYYGYRAAQVAIIASQVFAADPDRLHNILSPQTDWAGTEQYIFDGVARANVGTVSSLFDDYSITTYFGNLNGNTDADRASILSWARSGADGLTAAFAALKDGTGLSSGSGSLESLDANFAYHAAVAAREGINLVAYEGGVGLVAYNFSGAEQQEVTAFFSKIHADPRMGDFYTQMVSKFSAAGGKLLNAFNDAGGDSPSGTWGTLKSIYDQGSPAWDALVAAQRAAAGAATPPAMTTPMTPVPGTVTPPVITTPVTPVPGTVTPPVTTAPVTPATGTVTPPVTTTPVTPATGTLTPPVTTPAVTPATGTVTPPATIPAVTPTNGVVTPPVTTTVTTPATGTVTPAATAATATPATGTVPPVTTTAATPATGTMTPPVTATPSTPATGAVTPPATTTTIATPATGTATPVAVTPVTPATGAVTPPVTATNTTLATEAAHAAAGFTNQANYVMASDESKIAYAGADKFTATGNDLDNTITAGDGGSILSGGGGNDALIGGTGADVLDGGTGNDRMIGGAGDDVYIVDSYGDAIVELASGGTDESRASLGVYALPDRVENLTYTGIDSFQGMGNDFANIITGGAGGNRLSGGAGSDTLIGGDGADTLDGNTGVDRMIGRGGNDIYFVDNAGDQLVENINEGIDTVYSTITYTLADNVENLTLLGGGALDGTGNALDNVIVGNAAANYLWGGAGDDTLDGGDGDDVLMGGAGADVLTGGAGADRFAFRVGDLDADPARSDMIADFSRADGDKIDLSAFDTDPSTSKRTAFSFIGTTAFSKRAGELRLGASSAGQMVYGDLNGDGVTDFALTVSKATGALIASDFVL